jgi:predicted unusual protein kinase regulating ubiquinone biosynthesis (AarF/ABC1/UbiB family)
LYTYGEYWLFGDFNRFIYKVLQKLSKKNILYIKLVQACALNNDMFSNNINNKLIQFCDNAPWSTADVDIETLRELESEYQIHIVDKYQPINAGMISLVYKGASVAGASVAGASVAGASASVADPTNTLIIKIKRKHIEQRLHAAIEHVLFCLALLAYIPYINTYDFPAVVKKNIHLITQQVNFPNEVSNSEKYQRYCQHLTYIKIPKVYPAVTQRFNNVILMDYMEGKTLLALPIADREIYAKLLMKFVYITSFLHGCYHGDLHVGNLLFLQDTDGRRQLGILDFGLVYEIEKTKDAVFDIMSSILLNPPEQIAAKILQSGLIEPVTAIRSLKPDHYAHLVQVLANFIQQSVHVDKKLNHHQVFSFMTEMNTYLAGTSRGTGTSSHLHISDDFIKIQVFFAMNHGVILTLCSETNYIELSDQVMRETFHLDLFL